MVFYEFGLIYSTPEGNKVNGTFAYDLPAGTSILAPLDGLVDRISYQEGSDDYEVAILPSAVSDWAIIIDHLVSVTVMVGDTVTAGQIIGETPQGHTPELQINEVIIDDQSTFENRIRVGVVIHCPTKFVDLATRAQVQQLMEDWETFLGRAVYPTGMPLPGCTQLTITVP